jgi:hypothetical protein
MIAWSGGDDKKNENRLGTEVVGIEEAACPEA